MIETLNWKVLKIIIRGQIAGRRIQCPEGGQGGGGELAVVAPPSANGVIWERPLTEPSFPHLYSKGLGANVLLMFPLCF